jgi:hypothetical protein
MPDQLFSSPGFIVGLLLGVLAGWVSLWCFLNPAVGRTVARILAIACLAFGANWIVTPVADALRGSSGEHYWSPLGAGGFGSALGWGAAGLIAGLLALGFSFLRTGQRPAPKSSEAPPQPGDHATPAGK